ncbi:hypothetical protein FA13DRAFT_1053394 [Coprinellus micaceus]|uniref:Uncharacterized protein n=1 Tax=Coprinellus micaceus TaxID=71717 RepID=A0A4Y7SWV6_COPMI|nr:hypothetical protein FA13DRAFT_1053394 [Coprinellus micaceus]
MRCRPCRFPVFVSCIFGIFLSFRIDISSPVFPLVPGGSFRLQRFLGHWRHQSGLTYGSSRQSHDLVSRRTTEPRFLRSRLGRCHAHA